MANNDMEVIIYKISSHLYESIKLWHKNCLDDIAWRYKLFDTHSKQMVMYLLLFART